MTDALGGTSDTNGLVRATLTSGRRALSIRGTAQITAVSPAITTRSTAVNVLGAHRHSRTSMWRDSSTTSRGPLTGGSTIVVTTFGGKIDGGSIWVPDRESFNPLLPGLTQFTFVLSVDSRIDKTTPANITLTISSPNGNLTTVLTSEVVGP